MAMAMAVRMGMGMAMAMEMRMEMKMEMEVEVGGNSYFVRCHIHGFLEGPNFCLGTTYCLATV